MQEMHALYSNGFGSNDPTHTLGYLAVCMRPMAWGRAPHLFFLLGGFCCA